MWGNVQHEFRVVENDRLLRWPGASATRTAELKHICVRAFIYDADTPKHLRRILDECEPLVSLTLCAECVKDATLQAISSSSDKHGQSLRKLHLANRSRPDVLAQLFSRFPRVTDLAFEAVEEGRDSYLPVYQTRVEHMPLLRTLQSNRLTPRLSGQATVATLLSQLKELQTLDVK